MTTYAIIAACAAVVAAVSMFGIWFAHTMGEESGADELRADLAEQEKRRVEAAEQVLADPRTDSDTIERLRNNGF